MHLKRCSTKKIKATSLCIILMKLALRLIPRFPMLGKSPRGSSSFLPEIWRINVLWFMNRQNDSHPFMFEGSVHTGVVIACFDAFCQTLTQKTVVVMDNAFIHQSEEFEDRIPFWK